MHILFVITVSEPFGGAQSVVLDLARSFISDGDRVTIVVGHGGRFSEEALGMGAEVVIMPCLRREISPLNDIAAYRGLRSLIRERSPDIVSLHSSKAGVLGRIAASLEGKPAIFHAHGWAFAPELGRMAPMYLLMERLAARFTTSVITVSDKDRELALSANLLDASKVVTITNGIPDLVEPRLEADPARNPPRLVMVARHQPPKDYETLLRALRDLLDLDWSLACVGDGRLEGANRDLCSQLGLDDRTVFLGARRDVPEILAGSQILVLSSKSEGLPLSILEGMRAGLPIVAAAVGGIPDVVTEGKTGLLVPAGDPVALSLALRSLICSPSDRAAFGTASRRRYLEAFTLDRMFSRTKSAFCDAISEPSKS